MTNMKTTRFNQEGKADVNLIMLIVMIVLFVIAGSLAIWAYISYDKEKSNVEARVATAVSDAKKEQSDIDEKKFAEREKEPNRQFTGPDDFGRVVFNYPKTWSVYEAKAADSKGTYEAYLNPITVPTVGKDQKFALHVKIATMNYDDVLKNYEKLLEKGELKSTPFSANGNVGTRLDGNFDKDLRGAAVFLKIRDKTLTVQTDAPIFLPDFENIIKTIDFNK